MWSFAHLSGLAYRLLGRVRNKTHQHLKIAFGNQWGEKKITATAKASFHAMGKNVADACRIPDLVHKGLDHYIRVKGKEHLERVLARGNGAIGISGHIGCWELLGAALAKDHPFAVIGARIYDPRLDKLLVEKRQQAGYRSIPRTMQGTRDIFRWLKSGKMIGILIDQDTRVEGEFVDFMGKPAYTPVGPVVFAERTGAGIVPMAIHMNKDFTHTVEISPEILLQKTGDKKADRVENVLRCSKAVEKFIMENPTQWVWMHERWKTQVV